MKLDHRSVSLSHGSTSDPQFKSREHQQKKGTEIRTKYENRKREGKRKHNKSNTYSSPIQIHREPKIIWPVSAPRMPVKPHAPIRLHPTIPQKHCPGRIERVILPHVGYLADRGNDAPSLTRGVDFKLFRVPRTAVGRFVEVGAVYAHHVETRSRACEVLGEVDRDGRGLAHVCAGGTYSCEKRGVAEEQEEG